MLYTQNSRCFQSFSVSRPFKRNHPYRWQRLGSGWDSAFDFEPEQDRSEPAAEQEQPESVKYYTYTYDSQSKSSNIKSTLSEAVRSVKGAAGVVAGLAVDVLVVSVLCVGRMAFECLGYVVGGLVQGLVR
jgi:hypothetical protein